MISKIFDNLGYSFLMDLVVLGEGPAVDPSFNMIIVMVKSSCLMGE